MPEALCPIMVGRDAETSALQSAAAAARGGAGGLVFLTGEPGIGKSRLARDLADHARAHGMAVIAGRAVPGHASTPYRPLTEGVPRSFADAVRARLSGLGDDERLVVHSAAVLGRQFDWRLLPLATGRPASVVSGALERGVASMLLSVDGDTFRFRHALTREAVAGELLPHRRASVAAGALAAVEAAHPGLPGPWRDRGGAPDRRDRQSGQPRPARVRGGDPGRAGR